NGFSQLGDKLLYCDLPIYQPFWAAVERLDVPFYLHPRNPMPNSVPAYEGHPWLNGPTWGFHAETSVHALRLIGSGLFDQHPKLKSCSDISARGCRSICGGSTIAMSG